MKFLSGKLILSNNLMMQLVSAVIIKHLLKLKFVRPLPVDCKVLTWKKLWLLLWLKIDRTLRTQVSILKGRPALKSSNLTGELWRCKFLSHKQEMKTKRLLNDSLVILNYCIFILNFYVQFKTGKRETSGNDYTWLSFASWCLNEYSASSWTTRYIHRRSTERKSWTWNFVSWREIQQCKPACVKMFWIHLQMA